MANFKQLSVMEGRQLRAMDLDAEAKKEELRELKRKRMREARLRKNERADFNRTDPEEQY